MFRFGSRIIETEGGSEDSYSGNFITSFQSNTFSIYSNREKRKRQKEIIYKAVVTTAELQHTERTTRKSPRFCFVLSLLRLNFLLLAGYNNLLL